MKNTGNYVSCCVYLHRILTNSRLKIICVVPEEYKEKTQKSGHAAELSKYLREEKISLEFPGWNFKCVSFNVEET